MKKIIAAILLVFSFNFVANAATNAELKIQIEQLFKENPELVLNVVKDNSELILELAQQGSELKRSRAYTDQWKKDMQEKKVVKLEGRPTRGSADAPVKLIAFTDFTCSYCAQAAAVVEEVLKKYNGQVTYVFKQFPLASHENARLASEWFLASLYQDEIKAWGFYAQLFTKQNDLINRGEEALKELALAAELDVEKLQADLKKNNKQIKKIVEEDIADAERLGFNGTPHFLVNDLIIRGSIPYEDFVKAVDLALNPNK